MIFKVISGRPSASAETTLILQKDNWNDFGFQTLYQLYVTKEKQQPVLIGNVKILKKGQKAEDSHMLDVGIYRKLSDKFCSVGQSLDYYERLVALPEEVREFVLNGLRDIVKYPNIRRKFSSEEGWSTSLFRSISEESDWLQLAKVLLTRDYSALIGLNLNFSYDTDVDECKLKLNKALEFEFNSPDFTKKDDWFNEKPITLPNRISVLIGRNGSGKSTVLARLARLAFASTDDREKKLKHLGSLKPPAIGFSRIISISYSAFDSFSVPSDDDEEKALISKEIDQGIGRFIFCGLRDIAGETEKLSEGLQIQNYDNIELSERRHTTLLKSIDTIADEFLRLIDLIRSRNRENLLLSVLNLVFQEPSFQGVTAREILALTNDEIRRQFLEWSTGHKIVMHVVCSLVAHVEPRSLVLFDEPELHLHPPLLAAFMHAFRLVIEKKDAFAILATHSPVVLQETMKRHVHIIRRVGSNLSISHPKTETFGENVGLLTTQAFDLTTDAAASDTTNSNAADYHSILKELVNAGATLESLEDLFESGLSMQARAYVMSLLAADNEDR